ncbi:MAG TPA: alpha/beta hydrolase domain-containing protein, partial [Acidimicrobiales bacterium]|nr:alpha/beta hydrolase domain-containing protein [Acidimicrobiales bacterium]
TNNPVEDFDYVEEEWFVEGELETGPYVTLLLVRRPRDPDRFSGTLLVEPLRIQSRIVAISTYTAPYIMRSGHGWAMVVSQKPSLDVDVKSVNPERYEPLHIEAEAPRLVAFDLTGPIPTDDSQKTKQYFAELLRSSVSSHTILAQVGAALRGSAGPFAAYEPGHVILMGHSQTGKATADFLLETHDSQRLSDGRPVYDGFFPCGFPTVPLSTRDVPVVQVLSEGDILDPNGLRGMSEGRAYRRPDSDDPMDRFRLYELAGHAHSGTRYPPTNSADMWRSVGLGDGIPAGASMSSLPTFEMFRTALDHLVKWVSLGIVPPRAGRIETGADQRFLKDENGHSLGGVRCVQLDIPRAKHTIIGGIAIEELFNRNKLRALYKDHADYATRFNARLEELIGQGFFLEEDAPGLRQEAKDAAPSF